MNETSSNHLARADFFLCLARAFMVPDDRATFDALAELLADDLAELTTSLGYPAGDINEALRSSLREVPDHVALLQLYSGLFLMPPAPVCINTGRYLDGGVRGASELAMESLYRRCGLVRAEGFHDLADHVSVQLEFAALLFRSAAEATGAHEAQRLEDEGRRFLAGFAARWLPGFCDDLAKAAAERGLGGPYLHLARLLRAAVDTELALFPVEQGGDHVARPRRPGAVPRGGPTAEQLRKMAATLEAHGLAADHLEAPLASRDSEMGIERVAGSTPEGSARKGNCEGR
jgi:TorA maturation chaperone TorD